MTSVLFFAYFTFYPETTVWRNAGLGMRSFEKNACSFKKNATFFLGVRGSKKFVKITFKFFFYPKKGCNFLFKELVFFFWVKKERLFVFKTTLVLLKERVFF